jgi:hypothetical protein
MSPLPTDLLRRCIHPGIAAWYTETARDVELAMTPLRMATWQRTIPDTVTPRRMHDRVLRAGRSRGVLRSTSRASVKPV